MSSESVNNSNVCRICLRSCENSLNIFGKAHINNKILKDCLEEVCDFFISIEDNLPKSICPNCTETLEQCYSFRMLARKNDDLLHKTIAGGYIEESRKDFVAGIAEHPINIKCMPSPDNFQTTNSSVICSKDPKDEHTETIGEPFQYESSPNLVCNLKIDQQNEEDKSKNCILKKELLIEENDYECNSYEIREETEDMEETQFQDQDSLNLEHNSITQQPTEKNFKCKFCGQKFLYLDNKRQHEKRHKKGNLKCDLCERIFFSAYNLSRHLDTHTNEKRFECLRCGKVYRQSNTLSNHMKFVHLNQKEHQCNTCGKYFVTPSKVRAHQKGKRCSQKISAKAQQNKDEVLIVSKDSDNIQGNKIYDQNSEENTTENVWFTLTVMQ